MEKYYSITITNAFDSTTFKYRTRNLTPEDLAEMGAEWWNQVKYIYPSTAASEGYKTLKYSYKEITWEEYNDFRYFKS